MNKLRGKISLITGGDSGIGRAIAEKFASEGSTVIIIGRNKLKLKETVNANENISSIEADLSLDEDIENVVKQVKNKFDGELDILVNDAGWAPVQSLSEMTIADYDKAFNLDVRGLVNLTIQILPLLKSCKGTVINMSSAGLLKKASNLSMYLGAKSAVETFTQVWALELSSFGMRVNAIRPGAIETPIWSRAGLSKELAEKHQQSVVKGIPMNHMGKPSDVANVALFLVSDEAQYITGSIYNVDGGMGI